MFAIETRKLSKYYGKARGIVDLDLTVAKGEFFGFIGPNGAGKSTTIRTLLGLIEPSGGEASVLGMDIGSERKKILSRIGYLPSEAVFHSGMRVKDVLKLSADLRGCHCDGEAKALCARLGLDIGRKVEELSFGNRKKVGIVCALQHRPELLILDEPTSGLDPLMQREFFEILQERNRDGTTIFLSSHILSEIQRNCRRAAIIREGRIIACDSVEALARSNAKRVTLSGEAELSGLSGVRDLKCDGDSFSFLYGGDMDDLIRCLGRGHVRELSIAEPDLDEIFMHYYEEDGQ
ncbi:MAG: ABC transporter ATP-binding protein [Oscillospiraceae bacterium]|nr:ABC transporter ATP-binding protein [Oscillospiraceae bacterium]